ncbi:MAG: DinB family protein [Melioribacteraceae bacterium]|nr:DinB family protein [Melioribacteraceae bacterium]
MIQSIKNLFERDLNKLINEINKFPDEKQIWLVLGGVNNSPGNLSLHICGNLKHFIGSVLGNTGYKRERDKEFSLKNVPRKEVISNIEETREIVLKVFENLEHDILSEKYPINVFDREMTVEYFLIHLHSHLNYHMGQINYLRRVIIG